MEEEIWEQWEGHRSCCSGEELSLDMAIKQERWKHLSEEGHEIIDRIVVAQGEGKISVSSPAIRPLPGNSCSLLVGKFAIS